MPESVTYVPGMDYYPCVDKGTFDAVGLSAFPR